MRPIAISLLVVAAVFPVKGQKFEVASVKRAECEPNATIDPGTLLLRGMPLKAVLIEAFQVKTDRIEGPSWLDSSCVEVSAKMPEGATKEQIPVMLQALLAERFQLAFHREDRPRSGYALVVDKDGPKFKEDDPNTNFMGKAGRGSASFGFGGRAHVKAVMTMAFLARYLSGRGYGPVQDSTGLTGKYDIDLSWSPDPAFEPKGVDAVSPTAAPPNSDNPSAEPNLFAALRDSLGLKLERRKVSFEIIVIDRMQRVPTGN